MSMEKITEGFLIEQGWKVEKRYPLFTEFVGNTERYRCSLGQYGAFTVTEYHWMNHDEPIRYFGTLGVELTQDDYFTIMRLTGIERSSQQKVLS